VKRDRKVTVAPITRERIQASALIFIRFKTDQRELIAKRVPVVGAAEPGADVDDNEVVLAKNPSAHEVLSHPRMFVDVLQTHVLRLSGSLVRDDTRVSPIRACGDEPAAGRKSTHAAVNI
jgi:hypothetical protein